MSSKDNIKVLIVDDSILFRRVLSSKLSNYQNIEVVDTASDPYMARDKIIEHRPNVIILDIEMPKMTGLEFLKRLIPKYPVPTIVVSGLSDKVFEALDAGAVDFVAKPGSIRDDGIGSFIEELVKKIYTAAKANLKAKSERNLRETKEMKCIKSRSIDLIAIGASTGGTEAIYKILKELPQCMPGIVIAQHMPKGFTKMFAERLNHSCRLEVREAQSGDCVTQGSVFIAPGNYHMIVKKIRGKYRISCIQKEKVNGHRPSVDVLFKSIAKEAKEKAIGVILTGMGKDGGEGLLEAKKNGAITIGQDENTSIVYGMPKYAYEIGAITKQVQLEDISKVLMKIAID